MGHCLLVSTTTSLLFYKVLTGFFPVPKISFIFIIFTVSFLRFTFIFEDYSFVLVFRALLLAQVQYVFRSLSRKVFVIKLSNFFNRKNFAFLEALIENVNSFFESSLILIIKSRILPLVFNRFFVKMNNYKRTIYKLINYLI